MLLDRRTISVFSLAGILVTLGMTPASSEAQALQWGGKVVKTLSNVPVYSEAKAVGPAGNVTLFLTGAGERIKTVVFLKVHAYTIASYVDTQKKLDPAAPMKALADSRVKALHLTFLRDISADRVKSSFQDSLKENGVSLDSPEMKSLLQALDVNVKDKETLDIVGYKKADGSEALEFSFPKKTFTVDGKTIVTDFWKIWFGKPADSGLKDLQAALVGKEG